MDLEGRSGSEGSISVSVAGEVAPAEEVAPTGHEVAGGLRVGHGELSRRLQLPAEDRDDAPRAVQYVAEADGPVPGGYGRVSKPYLRKGDRT